MRFEKALKAMREGKIVYKRSDPDYVYKIVDGVLYFALPAWDGLFFKVGNDHDLQENDWEVLEDGQH